MRFGLYCRKSSEDAGKQIQSIDDQLDTLKSLAKKEGFEIVKTYTESRSAKTPGKRDKFNQMVEDLQNGFIEGIICWKLDRISRNQQEGGLIMQMLQDEVIKKIVTYDRTYYPSDNGLVMTVELGMATEYSRALAVNTKRGQKFKTKKGWYPSVAPLGYINTHDRAKGEKEIHPDPERFNLVRQLWDFALEDYSILEITNKAKQIGLTAPATRSKSEKPMSRSGIQKLFKNPFYYGIFQWGGDFHNGLHQPMISKEEFNEVQRLTEERTRPKSFKHKFSFTGIFRCGECGAGITAAHKDKVRADGSINHRTYYRCTGRKANVTCSQKAIRLENLERQMVEIIDSITLPEAFIEWAKKWLKNEYEEFHVKQQSLSNEQGKQLEKINKQIKSLLDLRLENTIDSDTFKSKNQELLDKKRVIENSIRTNTLSQDYKIEKTIETLEFCKTAKELFINGSREDKRFVLNTLGVKWWLIDGILKVELEKPFGVATNITSRLWINDPRFPTLPTKSEPEFDAETRELIKNGGGGEVLPPASINVQK